jgi:hypothetical protein
MNATQATPRLEGLGDLVEGLMQWYPQWHAKKLAEGKDLSGLPIPEAVELVNIADRRGYFVSPATQLAAVQAATTRRRTIPVGHTSKIAPK